MERMVDGCDRRDELGTWTKILKKNSTFVRDAGASGTPRSDVPTVYVVDDDSSIQKALSRLLRSAGYEAEVFSSALEFLAQASPPPVPRSSSAPACLVLDVQMPGLDGLALQEALGGSDDAMPIIFITGHGDIPMGVRAMKKGAVDFLTNPVDGQDLLDAVDKALRRDAERHRRQAATAEIQEREQALTPREREVMALVLTGLLNKQIAAELGIEEGTVKVHRGRVMAKMGAQSVAELVRMIAELPNAERGEGNGERGTGC